MEEGIESLRKRIEGEKIKDEKNIWQAIGRLKERWRRVSRYYEFELSGGTLRWKKDEGRKSMKRNLMDTVY